MNIDHTKHLWSDIFLSIPLSTRFLKASLRTQVWKLNYLTRCLLLIYKNGPTCTFNSTVEASCTNWIHAFWWHSSWIIKPEVIREDCRNKVHWITSSNQVFNMNIIPAEININHTLHYAQITPLLTFWAHTTKFFRHSWRLKIF